MARLQQDYGEFTVQADVGPGDETGIYHITVCNLPFDTSWQQLKDWLRPYCEVDHVEVFRTSTSGWVRVKGIRNFEKAWRRLNGGVFHGRSIIASDKNKTDPIKIKELLDFSLASSRDRQRSGEPPLTQPASPMLYGSSMAMDPNPSISAVSGAQHYYSSNVPLSWSYSHDPARHIDYAGPAVPSFQHVQTYPTSYYLGSGHIVPIHRHHSTFPQAAGLPQPYEGQQVTPLTLHESPIKSSRIVLKNIPHRCGAKDIELWVRRKLNSSEKGLDSVEVPLNATGVECTGHAYVRLNDSVAPSHALKKLNRHTFRGRTITASLAATNEDDSSRSKSAQETKSTEKVPIDSNSSSTKHEKKTHSSTSKASASGPLVVGGSSLRAKPRKL